MEQSLKTLVLILIIFSCRISHALVFYAPQNCKPIDMTLMVLSGDQQDQSFWIQIYNNKKMDEIKYDIPANTSLKIAASDFLSDGETYAIKTYSKKIRFYLSCTQGAIIPFSEITSPNINFKLTLDDMGYQNLNLLNLSPTSQNFQIDFLSDKKELLYSLQLHAENYMESIQSEILPPVETRTIEIHGEGRLSVAIQNKQNGRVYPYKIPSPLKAKAQKEVHYFLLSNPSGTESFIAPISDKKLIEEARAIIKNQLAKLTIATIEPGFNYNRNFSSIDRSPFSWQVAEVTHFADLAHIDCDGSPSLIEERFFAWMQSPQICFWSYHLKRELTQEEVKSGRLKEEIKY